MINQIKIITNYTLLLIEVFQKEILLINVE